MLLAAGCGAAESRPASGAAAEDYFPLVPGARWVYRLETDLGSLRLEVTAKGEMTLEGRDEPVFVLEETNRGPSLGFVETAPVAYVVEGEYVSRLEGVDYDEQGGLLLLGQDAAVKFLPRDPVPGLTWEQRTRLFQTPEGGGAQLGWHGEVKAKRELSLPSGTFSDVAVIEIVYSDVGGEGAGRTTAIYEDYYAKGVGLIRSVTRDPSGDPANSVELTLLEYEFPR